ncbi:hypothetical protein [Anabaena sp. PCC 7108]|uniref:hypothetical protein n=1 Tax=Anabaena sp. PCC 7108 TaxID=163908 RepID=UPI00034C5DE5|nr:hypothetical protein [Anabaena sp. PCC 7108]
MSNGKNSELEKISDQLQAIATAVEDVAQFCQGDVIALLALLRQLEKSHRNIRDGMFQDSLPDNRQRLYSLLKDIQSEGGWPYIERMRLQAFLVNLPVEASPEDTAFQKTHDVFPSDESLEW